MAAPSPNGRHTTSAQTVTRIVPVTRGNTPNSGLANSGAHDVPVRKSTRLTSPKNSIVGTSRASTMPTVVATDTSAASRSSARMTRSPCRGRDRRSDPGGVGETVAARGAGAVRVLKSGARRLGQGLELRLELDRLCLRQGHEQRLLRDLLGVVDVVLDEGLALGAGKQLGRGIDEQRAAQGLVLPALHGLGRRRHAAVAVVDRDALDLALVLLEVGQAEVTEAALGARHPGDGHFVVLGGVVVRSATALLAVDGVGEVVERAGVGAGAEQLELRVRELRVDL